VVVGRQWSFLSALYYHCEREFGKILIDKVRHWASGRALQDLVNTPPSGNEVLAYRFFRIVY
jgi:hypothetical protein